MMSLLFDENYYKELYGQRREQIFKYFSRRKADFLVVDIAKSQDVGEVVDFLGLPSWINFSMPHVNKTDGDGSPNSIRLLSPEMQALLSG